jgi:hypothetical protein
VPLAPTVRSGVPYYGTRKPYAYGYGRQPYAESDLQRVRLPVAAMSPEVALLLEVRVGVLYRNQRSSRHLIRTGTFHCLFNALLSAEDQPGSLSVPEHYELLVSFIAFSQ